MLQFLSIALPTLSLDLELLIWQDDEREFFCAFQDPSCGITFKLDDTIVLSSVNHSNYTSTSNTDESRLGGFDTQSDSYSQVDISNGDHISHFYRIDAIWRPTTTGSQIHINLMRIYKPEETATGCLPYHTEREVMFSNHYEDKLLSSLVINGKVQLDSATQFRLRSDFPPSVYYFSMVEWVSVVSGKPTIVKKKPYPIPSRLRKLVPEEIVENFLVTCGSSAPVLEGLFKLRRDKLKGSQASSPKTQISYPSPDISNDIKKPLEPNKEAILKSPSTLLAASRSFSRPQPNMSSVSAKLSLFETPIDKTPSKTNHPDQDNIMQDWIDPLSTNLDYLLLLSNESTPESPKVTRKRLRKTGLVTNSNEDPHQAPTIKSDSLRISESSDKSNDTDVTNRYDLDIYDEQDLNNKPLTQFSCVKGCRLLSRSFEKADFDHGRPMLTTTTSPITNPFDKWKLRPTSLDHPTYQPPVSHPISPSSFSQIKTIDSDDWFELYEAGYHEHGSKKNHLKTLTSILNLPQPRIINDSQAEPSSMLTINFRNGSVPGTLYSNNTYSKFRKRIIDTRKKGQNEINELGKGLNIGRTMQLSQTSNRLKSLSSFICKDNTKISSQQGKVENSQKNADGQESDHSLDAHPQNIHSFQLPSSSPNNTHSLASIGRPTSPFETHSRHYYHHPRTNLRQSPLKFQISNPSSPLNPLSVSDKPLVQENLAKPPQQLSLYDMILKKETSPISPKKCSLNTLPMWSLLDEGCAMPSDVDDHIVQCPMLPLASVFSPPKQVMTTLSSEFNENPISSRPYREQISAIISQEAEEMKDFIVSDDEQDDSNGNIDLYNSRDGLSSHYAFFTDSFSNHHRYSSPPSSHQRNKNNFCLSLDLKTAFFRYLQYLVSSVLDPDFLDSIGTSTYTFSDDYFFPAFRRIKDEIFSVKRSLISSHVWRVELKNDLDSYPKFLAQRLDHSSLIHNCQACNRSMHSESFQVILSGVKYDSEKFWDGDWEQCDDLEENLETKGDLNLFNEKDQHESFEVIPKRLLMMGRICRTRTGLYHQLQHLQLHLVKQIKPMVRKLDHQEINEQLNAILNNVKWLEQSYSFFRNLINRATEFGLKNTKGDRE